MEAGGWESTRAKMWTGRECALSQEAKVRSWMPDTSGPLLALPLGTVGQDLGGVRLCAHSHSLWTLTGVY